MAVEKVSLTVRGTQFLKESRSEIRKVVWPSRKDAIKVTIAVIALVFIAAIILAVMDWGFSSLIKFLIA